MWIIQRKPWRDAFAESIEKFWIKANQLDWIFHKVWIKSAWAEIEMQPMTSSLMMLEWSLRTSAVKVKVKIAPHQLWCHQWCHWCAKVTPKRHLDKNAAGKILNCFIFIVQNCSAWFSKLVVLNNIFEGPINSVTITPF